jgi:small subunit ribosomal protein S4
MKYTGPKAKRVRRQGVNLYGADKYDRILQRKPYGPGKSPKTRPGRRTAYAVQLLEKQKARDMYGMSEKQFRRMYDLASKQSGQTGDTLKALLERRLDNTVYRAGFARTRLQSRQFVGHGMFLVNGVRVTSPSFMVKEGMKIEVRSKTKSSALFPTILADHEKYTAPDWLKVNDKSFTIEVVSLPQPEHCEQAVDAQKVIEFYSRN